jgi:hypothetical protein
VDGVGSETGKDETVPIFSIAGYVLIFLSSSGWDSSWPPLQALNASAKASSREPDFDRPGHGEAGPLGQQALLFGGALGFRVVQRLQSSARLPSACGSGVGAAGTGRASVC